MRRNKDHRQGLLLGERLLQLHTAGSRHLQVEHYASGFRTVAFEKSVRRSKGFDSVIRSLEKAGQGAQKRPVVIYQIDDRWALMLDLGLGRGGVSSVMRISSLRQFPLTARNPPGGSGPRLALSCQPSAAYRSGIFRPKVQ